MKKIISIIFILAAMQTTFSNTPVKEDIISLPVKSDPSISIKVWFNVGSQNDPAGKEGLAAITGQMISEGATTEDSYETILEKLFPLAAGYDVHVSTEMTVYSGRIHKDNFKEYYPLFINGIMKPAFKEEDFTRIKDEYLNFLNNELKYSSDEELGKAVLYNEVYKNTPYGHIVSGTISGVESITLNDVKEFYKKYYNRNNFTLAIGGGYTQEMVNMLEADLKKLNDGQKTITEMPAYAPIKGLNAVIIEKPSNATAISMGFPISVKRGDREWYALAIANSWLGEHRNSSSHLYQVIREARGLNYGDYSYVENFPNGGRYQMPMPNSPRRQQMFEIWIRPVPNETRHFALRAALREFKNLVDNGMSKEDFNLTKKFLKKYALHYAPSTDMRLGYAVDDKFYGIKGSHLELFRKMMDEITLDEVNKAIKKHFQYENMVIAIITENGEKLKSDLAANVESPITYATPKSPEVYEEDKEIIKFPINLPSGSIKVMPVESLFK